jgi:hypothetical protein
MRRAVALLLLATATFGSAAAMAPPAIAGPPDPATIKPEIVWKKIPFGTKRKRQMAAYSNRHYAERTWRLTDPRVVVEHYTDGTSFDSAWGTSRATASTSASTRACARTSSSIRTARSISS